MYSYTTHTHRKVTQSALSSTTVITPLIIRSQLLQSTKVYMQIIWAHVQMEKAVKLESENLRTGSVAFLHSPLFCASLVKLPRWEIKTISGAFHWESLKLNIGKRVLSRVKIGVTIWAKDFTCFSRSLLPPNGGKVPHKQSLHPVLQEKDFPLLGASSAAKQPSLVFPCQTSSHVGLSWQTVLF